MSTTLPQVLVRRDGAVATLVFSNPGKRNALDFDMWCTIPGLVAELDRDPAVRVIVYTGEGERALVAGADISRFEANRAVPGATERFNEAVEAAYLAAGACSKPVIAKIRGVCMGGGLGLAAGCDLRIASDDAVFRMPAARLGLSYGFRGLKRFIDLIGAANSADIFFSARSFGAAEALAMGYVQRVVSAANLDSEVRAYCEVIAENAPLTLSAAKRCIVEALKDPEERDMQRAEAAHRACFASEDYLEGARAFMEKRPPRFSGR